jgi:hypothetical protein
MTPAPGIIQVYGYLATGLKSRVVLQREQFQGSDCAECPYWNCWHDTIRKLPEWLIRITRIARDELIFSGLKARVQMRASSTL